MELVAKPKEARIETVNWVVVDLQELAGKIGSGITPTGGSNIYKTQGRPFVRSQNIGWGNLKLDDIAYIEEAVHQTFPNTEIKIDDVFLNISGASIGRSSVATHQLVGGNVNQHVCIIRTLKDVLDSRFLCAYLLSSFGQRQIDSFQSGGNREGLNIGQIRTFKIPLPPLHEQQAIAQVLSDTDKLIQSLEKKIAKKKLIKQGVMQQLLTPKEGWEVKKLGELGDCIIGLTYSPDNVVDNGTLVLRSSNIQNDRLSFKDNVYVSVDIPTKLSVQKNDILICVRNGSSRLIGKCALINEKVEGQTFGAFMSVFRSPYNTFLFHIFQSNIIKKQIEEHLGATINQITNGSLNSFEVPLPPKHIRDEIAGILNDIAVEIEALQEKLSKYNLAKQGMMQQLLTGKIRLV